MSLPDGPKVIPFVHSLKWRGRFLEFLDYCAQRYGDIFTIRVVGSNPFVVVSHPQAIQEIFTAPAGQFVTGRANQPFRPILGDHSLLLLDGASHQQQRRLLMPPFHGECLRAYGQLICDITEQEVSQWAANKPFAIRPALENIALRIILEVVFGSEQRQQIRQLRHCLCSLLDSLISPLLWQRFSFSQKKQQVDELIYTEISYRRKHVDPCAKDVLSLLVSARDEADQPMTDEEIRDELMTLVMAGYETTTTALVWAIYWTIKLPEIRDKLKSELDSLGSNPSPIEIGQLLYLTAVCSEALRIYSITGFTFDRVVKVPLKLMGYDFEPGTVLSPCIYLIHQRKEIYPEPKHFKPERFLEQQFSPYEYFPFGGGNRRCIGMAFAQMEIKLVLATIISHSFLSLVNRSSLRPVHRGITLAPPLNLQMVMVR